MGKGSYNGGGSILQVFYRPSNNKSMQIAIGNIDDLNSRLSSQVLSDKEYVAICEKLLHEFGAEDRLKLANKMLLPIPSIQYALKPSLVRKKKGRNKITAGKKFHSPRSAKPDGEN